MDTGSRKHSRENQQDMRRAGTKKVYRDFNGTINHLYENDANGV